MAGNTFGNVFKITTFGESHGKSIGVIIDGCPAGIQIDSSFIQNELDRRRPGQSKLVSQRKEFDVLEILSGVFDGFSLGTPIAILVNNGDQKSSDYNHLAESFRPSHADFTYTAKYGIRDFRGGGRASARETVARVIGGAVAKLFLKNYNINITAFVSQVGAIKIAKPYHELDFSTIENTPVRCPDDAVTQEMINLIKEVKKKGDTIGGIIQCVVQNCPVGLGEPVFNKLHSELGGAMLSINACKGFEIGSGFDAVTMLGSEHNDIFTINNNKIETLTNNSGGIQGGISNGMDIYFRAAFKPVATIMKPQPTVNQNLELTTLEGKGRHDPCVVPRAVPIVEAMTALVIADYLLLNRISKLK
ncbi:MAG: chorismate synthase [Saprospiraceae bacterium]|nr:chorismate synthase [Saprospiraceae bacterium]